MGDACAVCSAMTPMVSECVRMCQMMSDGLQNRASTTNGGAHRGIHRDTCTSTRECVQVGVQQGRISITMAARVALDSTMTRGGNLTLLSNAGRLRSGSDRASLGQMVQGSATWP